MEEELYKDPVPLANGITMSDLTSSEMVEFQIDVDFTKKHMNNNDSFIDTADSEDSDSEEEDILENLEASTHKLLLSSPEYQSFEQLAPQMIDCVTNGNVKLLILEEGDGPLIPETAEVTLHYAAYWEKATIPFDTTLTMNQGQPLRLRLGEGRNIPGLEIGLTHVKGPQARFHLLLHPSVTWGERGILPRIKPERALFVITVYDVRHVFAAKRFNDLPQAEQAKFQTTIQTLKDIREQGKTLFARQKYHSAIKCYQQAISVLNISRPETEPQQQEIKKLKIKIYINLAVCYIKTNKPKLVLNICENIDTLIDIDNHCKALFLRGKAFEIINRVDDAILSYKKALKLEPKNIEIGKVLAELDKKNKNAAVSERGMWQKVFNSNVEKKVAFDVDDVFKDTVKLMCQDLAGRKEFAKFDLPAGVGNNEMEYIKYLTKDFKDIIVFEDGEGSKRNVSIVKKIS